MNDFHDLEIGARYVHNKTGAEYELTAIDRTNATIQDPDGRSIRVPIGVLENLYSIVEADEPEPAGILPIGSVSIEFEGPTPPPALGSRDDDEPLEFRRPGRPRNDPIKPFDSYFGEPRKLGPKKK